MRLSSVETAILTYQSDVRREMSVSEVADLILTTDVCSRLRNLKRATVERFDRMNWPPIAPEGVSR